MISCKGPFSAILYVLCYLKNQFYVFQIAPLVVYILRSILHLSCRTSDLQFSLVLQIHSPSFKRICNKEHKGVIYVIRLPRVIHPKALILLDESCGENYLSFLDFTCNYERSGQVEFLSPGPSTGVTE